MPHSQVCVCVCVCEKAKDASYKVPWAVGSAETALSRTRLELCCSLLAVVFREVCGSCVV